MHPSRATLATTGMLLSLLFACTEQAVVPTEPSRVATMPSIPGSSSANVRTGPEAQRFLEEKAAEWSSRGDVALSRFLDAERAMSVTSDRATGPRHLDSAASRPSLVIIDGGGGSKDPSPSTRPNAHIYYSSTAPYLSGSSGVIVSSVTYYGNIATTDLTYSARNAAGVVIPQNTVHNRGEGEHANCLGPFWECSFTFRFQTVVALSNLGAECGVTVMASATHRAEWTYPAFLKVVGSTWGTELAVNGPSNATNGLCAPPPPPPSSPTGGDGSAPPTTGTTQSPTYQPAPFVPSGHWECYLTNVGTDLETERCTWYADYDRLPKSMPSFALSAADKPSSTLGSADLPSVFVIVSDQVPADAMAVIERRRQGPFKNVLLVPSSTIRPAVLVAALRALSDSRGKAGEMPAKDLTLTLKGDILDQQIPAAARVYAAGFTALVAKAKRGDAGPYGLRPILELRLADRK
jgi:hypothetical protein